MKFAAAVYLLLILTLSSLSAFLAYKKVGGWGWFLIFAGLIAIGFSYKEKTSETKEDEDD